MELTDETTEEQRSHVAVAAPSVERDRIAELAEACLMLAASTQQLADVVAATIEDKE